GCWLRSIAVETRQPAVEPCRPRLECPYTVRPASRRQETTGSADSRPVRGPRRITAALVALALLVLAPRAFALDPNRALTQAQLSVWTNGSGLPQTTIDALVQTNDGY